jgi:hypothetical protein
MRRVFIAVFALMAGCHTAVELHPMAGLSLEGEVRVAASDATFAFPQLQVRDWSCSYRAGRYPNERVYSWSINVTGPETPWYTIDVWPLVPESLATQLPRLGTILAFARPEIGIAGGEPPLKMGTVEGTPSVTVERERLVVRVGGAKLVRRLFQSHPDSVRVVACVDGNDQWTRVLPVRYQ